jgi:predicted Zn-ribbon and HTH transcriptional regulator
MENKMKKYIMACGCSIKQKDLVVITTKLWNGYTSTKKVCKYHKSEENGIIATVINCKDCGVEIRMENMARNKIRCATCQFKVDERYYSWCSP